MRAVPGMRTPQHAAAKQASPRPSAALVSRVGVLEGMTMPYITTPTPSLVGLSTLTFLLCWSAAMFMISEIALSVFSRCRSARAISLRVQGQGARSADA